MTKARPRLRRFPIWLGWVVALPLFLWTLSGLLLIVRPIEASRGEGLIGEAPPLPFGTIAVPPQIGPRPVISIRLVQRPNGAKWVISYADGGSRLADAATGRLLPPINAAQARAIVEARYQGAPKVKAVDRPSADSAPFNPHRNGDVWRVTLEDGTEYHVSAATGEIMARRTGGGRFYDLMRRFHILDTATREDGPNRF